MPSPAPTEPGAWSTLRRFVRPRPAGPRCDLCGAPLGAVHSHLLEPANRQIQCSCDACAVLFSSRQDARYRRVEPRAELLTEQCLTDAQWDDLHLPINLAYFVYSSRAGRVQAFFPSPAGATESLLTFETCQAIAAENPPLRALEPDVEALLVNRLGRTRDHYIVSVDECYTLVGLIRSHWRGLSGGAAVWDEIARFFAGLKQRARPQSESGPPGGTRDAGPQL